MGRSVSSPDAGGRRCGGALARLALGFAIILVAGSALAQSAATQGAAARNPDKLVVEANELVYDKDHNTISAVGGVELYYKHRVLQADRVIYDRTTKRLYAEGRAKLTDEKGNVTYAKRFDLTDDFAAGFAEGVESVSTDRTRFTSPRVERSPGQVTVFNSGVYTACEPCKAHPERPPLWHIRAAKIIENQQTHIVYFEDAWLEVAGVPVAYIPYFSAPDPTVTRQSGLLSPTFSHGSYTGTGIGVPYFLNLAPNYDLTIAPTYFTSQGPFLDAEWRHRLDNGQYDVRVNGLFQENPGLFPAYPWDSGDRRWRGSVESTGEFYLNDKWRWGWDITAMSDPFYLNDYKIKTVDLSQYYLQDVVSSVYLRGQADRGYLRSQRLSVRKHDRRRRPAPAAVCRAGARLQQDDRGFARGDRRSRRRNQDRPQRDQYRARRGGLSVDERPDARQGLQSLQCLRGQGYRKRLRAACVRARQLPASRHRRRLRARVRASVVAAQVRRPARRDLDAVRLRPARRRDDGAEHRWHLHLRRRPARSTIRANTITSARTPARPDAPCRASASNIDTR